MTAETEKTHLEHFPDAAISVFQSVLASVDMHQRAGDPAGAVPAPVDHAAPVMVAAARAATTLAGASPAGTSPSGVLRPGALGSTLDRCARAYLGLALAQADGDAAAIAAAEAALPPFGTCDPRWAETLRAFLLHFPFGRRDALPYRKWRDLGDFVLPDPRDPAAPAILTADARVALISDWGTGGARPQALLEAVAALKPDVLIHLGDIYYSCNSREARAFFDDVRAVFPEGAARVFTLCGNHDLYAGGEPYYALLDCLGQPASFFSLRNAHWQFVAADTGYNDFDPFREGAETTWVRDGTAGDGTPDLDPYSELAWHADKLGSPDGRRTVLMSHHPPFSRRGVIRGGRLRNERLLTQFAPWLDTVDLWFWGHEHCQIVYAPFAGVTRGRCLGAGAIPTLPVEAPYDPAPTLFAGETVPELLDDPASRLRLDAATGFYDLGFALMTLAGQDASVAYYSFDETRGAAIVYEETL